MLLAAVLLWTAPIPALAFEPYHNYTYDRNGESQGEPQAYLPVEALSGESVGAGAFITPKDVFVSADRKLYVADTGNDRIVVLNDRYETEVILKDFQNGGQADGFNKPQGVYVAPDGRLYVADTGNERIVVFGADRAFQKAIGRPDSAMIDASFSFSPVKVAVDAANRLYVASKNVTQGVLELDEDGQFVSFMGAVPIKLNFFKALWRMIATQEQKDRMLLTVPTEYSSIDMDSDGFIYGVVSAIDAEEFDSNMFVHRLNPMGTDVLKRNGFSAPMGDVEYYYDIQKKEYEVSLLNDVAVREQGIYSVLDTRKGRVFTYTGNGELMYVFGALGSSLGQFGVPEAIDTLDDRLFVVDSKYNHLVVFEPTRYGRLITDAVEKYARRDYDGSNAAWMEALKYTSKSDLAFAGIGKALNNEEKYDEAMKYLRYASDRTNYSTSFENFRNQVVDRYFTWIVGGLAALAAGLFIVHLVKTHRKKKGGTRHDR